MADLREELPYRTEYAKSGRAGCKSCKENIAKDSLRMAVMVQSPFFDGKQPNWHHFQCFFKKYRPKVEEIAHFASLKFDDQKRIEEAIQTSVGAPTAAPTNGSTKKRTTRKKKASEEVVETTINTECVDFNVEYAKSNRSKCRLCDNTITKDSIRIGKLDRDSEDARRFGPLFRWFHVECFVSGRESLGFYESAENLPNFAKLEETDKKELKIKLKKIKAPDNGSVATSASPTKKPKLSETEEKALKKQSDLLFKYIQFAESMAKPDLAQLMEYNKIEVPATNQSKWERLADAMAFGPLAKCPECKKGQLVFRSAGYICTGNVTQWTACEYQTTDNPKRKEFKVPKDLAEEYEELKKYKFKKCDRLLNPTLKEAAIQRAVASTSSSSSSAVMPKKEENNNTTAPPLNGYKIASIGKLKTKKTELKSRLKKLGASLVDSIDRTTLCVISSKKDVDKEGPQVIEAKDLTVPIVSEEFLAGVENGSEPIQAISLNRLDSYEVDIEKRFNNLNVKEKMKSAFKSGSGSGRFEKSGGKQKMILKGGNVVDPECEVADVTHIYKDGKDAYNAVLSRVDLTKNKNSFYKIQLLKRDKSEKYYVFRSWGRVGTTIGGTSLDKFSSKEDAINAFEKFYEEKTQNKWSNRHKFKKYPDCYFPVDIDYGGDSQIEKLDSKTSTSNLPKAVQDLICMIFDVQKMKEQMLEFELDLEKMPLGKLSKKQLLKACSVLKELSQLIETKPPNATKIKDATNRFYTLIPHNFGTDRPPLINSEEMIKSKMDMLEALLDIEMAYEMINSTDEENLDPIDHHYKQLNALIHPLSREEEEFVVIEKYLKNTHGSTHSFSLEIEEIFKVERNGEADRYLQKYKDLENRMLLWHGSRVTNFAGILSQGLRIAPPEAPVTGYMFGKGIYFADMVTKSAGYCYHHTNKNVGLLLLSEVAVGQPWELFDAKDVKKLPKDKHSVKGVGKTTPDPNEVHVMPNGVKVPIGKGVQTALAAAAVDKCSLLYNEYIVYDVNQVNIKYLLKCKFNQKSLF